MTKKAIKRRLYKELINDLQSAIKEIDEKCRENIDDLITPGDLSSIVEPLLYKVRDLCCGYPSIDYDANNRYRMDVIRPTESSLTYLNALGYRIDDEELRSCLLGRCWGGSDPHIDIYLDALYLYLDPRLSIESNVSGIATNIVKALSTVVHEYRHSEQNKLKQYMQLDLKNVISQFENADTLEKAVLDDEYYVTSQTMEKILKCAKKLGIEKVDKCTKVNLVYLAYVSHALEVDARKTELLFLKNLDNCVQEGKGDFEMDSLCEMIRTVSRTINNDLQDVDKYQEEISELKKYADPKEVVYKIVRLMRKVAKYQIQTDTNLYARRDSKQSEETAETLKNDSERLLNMFDALVTDLSEMFNMNKDFVYSSLIKEGLMDTAKRFEERFADENLFSNKAYINLIKNDVVCSESLAFVTRLTNDELVDLVATFAEQGAWSYVSGVVDFLKQESSQNYIKLLSAKENGDELLQNELLAESNRFDERQDLVINSCVNAFGEYCQYLEGLNIENVDYDEVCEAIESLYNVSLKCGFQTAVVYKEKDEKHASYIDVYHKLLNIAALKASQISSKKVVPEMLTNFSDREKFLSPIADRERRWLKIYGSCEVERRQEEQQIVGLSYLADELRNAIQDLKEGRQVKGFKNYWKDGAELLDLYNVALEYNLKVDKDDDLNIIVLDPAATIST